MASISASWLQSLSHTNPNHAREPSHFPRFIAASPRHPLSSLKRSDLGLCRCSDANSGSPPSEDDGGWKNLESILHGAVSSAVKRFEDCVNSFRKLSDNAELQQRNEGGIKKGAEAPTVEEEESKDWNWERWRRHFSEIEEHEWIASVLKMQLRDAVAREDYEAAAKLKLALHASRKSDTVGSAIHEYNKAIAEERYTSAAFFRDNVGTGLLGWWSGISDGADNHGRIVHISAEHGRYVGRSYSSRQLTMSSTGSPLFEIYFTCGDEGYKQQAVYLKRSIGHSAHLSKKSPNKTAEKINESIDSTEGSNDIPSEDIKTIEEVDDDSDWINGLSGIKNILQDVIPGVKVKVLKVVAPGKVDRDLISKVIEQIIEDDEDSDEVLQDSEEEYAKVESDVEEIEMVDGDETSDTSEEQSGVSVRFVISSLFENMTADAPPKDLIRVPAELEIRDHLSFSFSVKKDDLPLETRAGQALQDKIVARSLQRSSDHVRSDLSKDFATNEKSPFKVLVDIGELISLSMNHIHNHQLLSGTTHFNRIAIPATSDPLSGLYIGAHGMYTSELLHLKRRFGQWHEDDASKKITGLEFYEYVEAYKLTGALSIPAGQVVFRAKIGKKYQLPHKGIIPEEFGVIARYRAQGRLADPGFQNPRWVDGELVILDGKNIRGGPVIGFVYWAPEHHFLVFFNRLRLPE